MYHWLNSNKIQFPPVDTTNEDGILALGGDLSLERLKLAYSNGIFPWYSKGQPIIWWCPNPRMVLFPDELKVSKSMRKILREKKFQLTYNQNFKGVIENCSKIKREHEQGTWILPEMLNAYIKLHKEGWAKSIEVWQNNELVGGLYGIDLGNVFCGESMFSKVSNASKFGFVYFVQNIFKGDLIDCQVHTNHLESLGAKEISREDFLAYLK